MSAPPTADTPAADGAWPVQRAHRIRWAECDLYAHVNHAAYLTLCEDLRVRHWLDLGGSFAPGEAGPVVASLEARYLRPLRFDQQVLLTMRTSTLRRTSFVHDYGIWRDGLAFSARAVIVVTQGEAKVPIPPAIRAALLAQGAREEGNA